MGALFYIYKRTFINRMKRALKKPVTYVYIILIAAYGIGIVLGTHFGVEGVVPESPVILAVILSCLTLFTVPSNLLVYARRKGLLFKPSDTHFVFSAPISPKMVMVYAQVKNLLMGIIIPALAAILAVAVYENILFKMILYVIFAIGIQNLLESSLMIILYGNERFSEKTMKFFGNLMWVIIIAVVGIFAFMIFTQGMRVSTFTNILFSPVLKMVPIIGWNIAVIQLLILDPELFSIVGAVLYAAATVLAAVAAKRMRCTGNYYEDAAKFAEDYQTLKQKNKKGESSVAFIGQKKKYGKAEITYKGTGAKAIFYRQILEYKKNRFFIFGLTTLFALAIGVGMAVYVYIKGFEYNIAYLILGVEVYMCICLSAYATKWSKELESPYTFLMPDTAYRKMWYATLMEHIRAAIDGCLMTIPVAVLAGLGVMQTILLIIIYVCINANKLYASVLVEYALGNLLGIAGKQLTRILFQSTVYGIGVLICVVGVLGFGTTAGFLMLVVYAVGITGVISAVASSLFSKMESIDS